MPAIMPKFPFARRKSTNNALDVVQDPPAEPTFRVFERHDGASKSFDGAIKLGKTMPPGSRMNPFQRESSEDNIFAGLKVNRNSETSHTNTASTAASTADNSSRLSGASTAPSSTDLPRQDDAASRQVFRKDIPIPAIPKSTPSAFSIRNAGRAMSWSRNKSVGPPIHRVPEPPPPATPGPDEAESRSRGMTTSTYASTATPPKIADEDLTLNMGGDFGDMFSGLSNRRRSTIMDVAALHGMSYSPEYQSAPTTRPGSGRAEAPQALNLDQHKQVETPPYSWSTQHSHDRLPAKASPLLPGESAGPPVPPHRDNSLNTLSSFARQPRPSGAPENGLKRSSAVARRQSTLEFADGSPEDARLLHDSIIASQSLTPKDHSPKVRDSWAPSNASVSVSSLTASPKEILARNLSPRGSNDSIFDSAISESAGLALRFQEQLSAPSPPPAPVNKYAPKNKVMTPAQFERYRQERVTLKALGGAPKDEEDDADVQYVEEEDESDKQKRMAKQRRQQEAHMALYRQQMMKVTGESLPPMTAARPSMTATQSTPNLLLDMADDGEDEDEDIPLGILAAHGFPSKNRPPNSRLSTVGSNPNLRATANNATGGHGKLPAFARNLPKDPYVGAGLVYPSNRESLALGSARPTSVYAGPRASMVQPGGLVGVIANEERSRAMRRGSPNAQGEYPAMPQHLQNPSQGLPTPQMSPMMPQMQPPGMLSPGDQAQIQMSQQMSQFMQMQMQFMQMMTANGGQATPVMSPMLSPGMMDGGRPVSQHMLRPGNVGPRPPTILEPNMASWGGSTFAPSVLGMPAAGYTPSIAPSERSNVGLPGRYRPVSQAAPQISVDRGSRTSTLMSGGLANWEGKQTTPISPAVRSVSATTSRKANTVDDEDDDEGWEEMAKKRDKKRSLWRTKRDTTNGLKDILAFADS